MLDNECCVSFLFWRETGFGFTYYILLMDLGYRTYSCGVVLVFLVLAGNSFWCYVHTTYSCAVVSFLLLWQES